MPPTLISFATTISEADRVISPEFKEPGHKIVSVSVQRTADGRVDPEAFKAFYEAIQTAIQTGKVVSAWSVGQGGIIEGLYKMAIGNRYGVTFAKDVDLTASSSQPSAPSCLKPLRKRSASRPSFLVSFPPPSPSAGQMSPSISLCWTAITTAPSKMSTQLPLKTITSHARRFRRHQA